MERKNNTSVDPKAREQLVEKLDQVISAGDKKNPNPQKRTEVPPHPNRGECTYLRERISQLEDRLFRAEKDTSLKRVGITSLCTFGVYCSWACEWVNMKFLIAVSAIAIAVIAATLGSLWEKTRNRGGEIR